MPTEQFLEKIKGAYGRKCPLHLSGTGSGGSRNPPDGTGRVERTAAHRQIKSKGVPHRYCGNLMLEASPLLLTRSAHDNRFQILWPERRDFAIEDHEFLRFWKETGCIPGSGTRIRTIGRRSGCGIMRPEKCWSGSRVISVPCRMARTGFWCERGFPCGWNLCWICCFMGRWTQRPRSDSPGGVGSSAFFSPLRCS